ELPARHPVVEILLDQLLHGILLRSAGRFFTCRLKLHRLPPCAKGPAPASNSPDAQCASLLAPYAIRLGARSSPPQPLRDALLRVGAGGGVGAGVDATGAVGGEREAAADLQRP